MVSARRPSAAAGHQTASESGTIDPQVLLEISKAVASTLELKPLLDLILEQLQILVPYAGASVDLNEDGMLRQVAVRRPRGPRPTPRDTEFSFPLSVFDQMGIPLGEGSAQIIDDVHGTSKEAKQYRSLFGGDLKGTPVEYVRSFLGLPLIARDRIVGTLTMSHDEPGYFGPQHIEQLTPIASQAALAIDNARLFEQAQSRTRELSVLLDVSRALGSTLELRPLLEVILDQLRTVVPYDGAGISMIEGDSARQIAARRPPGYPKMDPDEQRPVPLTSFGMVWDVVRREKALIIDDIFDDSDVARSYRATWGADQPPVEYARSYAVVPLVIRDQVIGALAMAHHEPGYFKQEHIEVVRALAAQAAAAIENARLYEETQRRARQTAALLEVSRAVASTLDTRALMGVILDQLNTIVDHTGSAILTLVDGELEIVDARAVGSEREIGIRIPLDSPTALWNAINSGEAVIIDDVRSDETMARDYRTIITSAGLWDLPPFQVMRSWMAVPLVHKDQVIGMLTVSQAVAAYFKPEHARLARAFADQAALAIENARLFAQTDRGKRELDALLQTSHALASTLELKPLLERILEELRHFVDYAGASVNLLRDGMLRQLAVRRPRGPAVTSEDTARATPENTFERVGVNIQAGEPLLIDDVHGDSAEALLFRDMYGGTIKGSAVEYIRSFMNLPLLTRGELVGVLTVTHEQPGFFRPEHADLLRPLAAQAALAIDNARLFEQAQLGAALEERQRLARELHDSVSQALYGIALGARTARTLLDRNPADAVEPLDYISSLAEAGLTEMRALIFELRPESLETEGLVVAISKQAAALQARHGLAIECRLDTEPQLSLPVKETLYRITQQALHNTVKHAKATIASVVLDVSDDETTVTIQDNGAGFDPEGDFPGHLGLRSMRERAVKSGGTVSIESAPGSGTLVRASFPR